MNPNQVINGGVEAAIARAFGQQPRAITVISRGHTPAFRAIATFGSSKRIFVKVGTSDETIAWLRAEAAAYDSIVGPFMPHVERWVDNDAHPVLGLEDLSDAYWPPPWDDKRISQLVETIAEVQSRVPPPWVPRLSALDELVHGWERVAAEPGPFLSLGLTTGRWLERSLPTLLRVDSRRVLEGDALVHGDLRSDNVCFTQVGAKLIDWNWTCVGSPTFDLAAWLPSLTLEGGKEPADYLRESKGASVVVAGYFASRAGLSPPPGAPLVRSLQLAQLRVALPWATREAELAPPDGPAFLQSVA